MATLLSSPRRDECSWLPDCGADGNLQGMDLENAYLLLGGLITGPAAGLVKSSQDGS